VLDRVTALTLGVLLLAATLAVAVRDARPEYGARQARFRQLVEQRLGAEAAAAVPAGIQQIWLPGVGRADRCPTCHQAVVWRGFERETHPWRTHPPAILSSHPVERFGCTICHGGQGWAVATAAAHGHVPNWSEPLLGDALAASLAPGLRGRQLQQVACNGCHRYESRTAGAEVVNRGKQLLEEKGCRACHRVDGRGGLIGPDLTWEGDKYPGQFDYARLSGRPTVFGWHLAHFADPRALVPGSVMPNFHLSVGDAAALTVLATSWRTVAVDPSLLGATPRRPAPPAGPTRAAGDAEGPGGWFIRTGCAQCHDVTVFGVKSPTPIGPDLSTAAEDTERRFSVPIETFVRNPTGVMEAVFARQLMLSPAQKDEAVRELRAAWAAEQARAAAPR
jgi:cytochrome c551/c552